MVSGLPIGFNHDSTKGNRMTEQQQLRQQIEMNREKVAQVALWVSQRRDTALGRYIQRVIGGKPLNSHKRN